MTHYTLYNNDVRVASFTLNNSIITEYKPERPELLPMQIRNASADGFSAWVSDRAIDLSSVRHRNLMYELLKTRDKIVVAVRTCMFSLTDAFTCFEEDQFVPRSKLCKTEDQNTISDFILVSSETSLRKLSIITPNASTDGSFTKTWRYENGAWWLYKLQSSAATRTEVEISRTLRSIGWDAAEYAYDRSFRRHVKTRNFLSENEFLEPYASFRFYFDDPSDDDEVIYRNLASLGSSFKTAWKRILLSDALFNNTDRHMHNFGVIRSTATGDVLRLAPNFDNNQAYLANPSATYQKGMLAQYMNSANADDYAGLRALSTALEQHPYLKYAYEASLEYIK